MTSVTERLEVLLSESVNAAIRRESSAFDEIASPFEQRLILFGAGGLGRRTLAGLRKAGIEPLAFADNSERLQGTMVDGIRVLAPADAARAFGSEATFVITTWNGNSPERMKDKRSQLMALGCQRVATAGLLYWKYPATLLPFYPIDLPHKLLQRGSEVTAAFQALADDASRREYVAQVSFRLLMDSESMGDSMRPSYFLPDVYRLRRDEFLVDCGAFDGDTIRDFIRLTDNSFARVLAFEPDQINWGRLTAFLATLPEPVRRRISAFRQCVSDRTGEIAFETTGTDLAASGRGSETVSATTLDELQADVGPSIVKLDIEGAELQALRGAIRTIRRCRPVLAVCAYHQQSHLWEVPLHIMKIETGYKLYLRPHGTEGWDLVCYAVPEGRSMV